MAQADYVMDTVLSAEEAELAKVAQRCVMTALDHSRAPKIALIDGEGQGDQSPILELPPKVLRLFAEMLGRMAQQQPVALLPLKMELSTQEAAARLNVSRPFIVKEVDSGKIRHHRVGRHRRIYLADLLAYQERMQRESEQALQELAAQAQ
ncbi:MAG: excisionase family DNA-binding protein, partial [Burkholderiaceae bacterium]